MTTDGRRGVNITYNVLNLPETVVAGDQKVSYIYDAAGQKLASNANGSLTYYRSVMVYGNDNKLLYLLTPEGTVNRAETSSGVSYTYNYFKRDQVGSTRVMLSAVNGILQVQQSTDYYPFGLSHENSNLHRNKYLFSGKELQDGQVGGAMLGLYDFGARPYDPTLGRWLKMDRYAEKYASVSPYNYCLNNPILIIDPSGDTTIYIGGYAFHLEEGKNGNFSFDLKTHTGTVSDNMGNDVTTEMWNNLAGIFDSELQTFAFLRLGFSIGDYGIQGLTTKSTKRMGHTGNGLFYGTNTQGKIFGADGFFDPDTRTVHIAPILVKNMHNSAADAGELQAVLVHELVHGLHHYLNPGSAYDSDLSEAAAYQAAYDTYMFLGMEQHAYNEQINYNKSYKNHPMGFRNTSYPTWTGNVLNKSYNLKNNLR